jgi:hypothetical protein
VDEPAHNENDEVGETETWTDWLRRRTRIAEDTLKALRLDDWVQAQRRRKWQTAGHQVRREDGRWASTPGTYVLDWCYGGVRLAQIANEGGGERDITGRGTKRETYHRMHSFLRGLEAAPCKETA